jgi:hypothetical protein
MPDARVLTVFGPLASVPTDAAPASLLTTAGKVAKRDFKAAPVGSFDPADYGAVGDGTTDDRASFVATMLAINPDTSWSDTKGARLVLKERTDYKLGARLELTASHTIEGAGGASPFSEPSTRLVFGTNARGIGGQGIWVRYVRGSDKSNGAGASLRNLCVVPSDLTETIYAFPYGAVTLGRLYSQEGRREFLYEAIKAGATMGRPWPAWAAATAYSVGDYVTPTTLNGHVYRCVKAGTSGASEPLSAGALYTSWDWYPDMLIEDNDVIWEEAGSYHQTGHQDLQPFVDAHDPRVKWTTGQTYEYNDVVWVETSPGVPDTANLYKVGTQGGQLVGGTAGATPPTPGVEGTTVSDGGITWTRYDADGYFWTPGPQAEVIGTGTYPTGFAGGETLTIGRDGEADVVITFQAGDQTKADVIARINAAFDEDEPIADHNGRVASAALRLRGLVRGTGGEIRVVSASAPGVLTTLGFSVGDTNAAASAVFFTRYHGGLKFDAQCELEYVQFRGGECDQILCIANGGSALVSANTNASRFAYVSSAQAKAGFMRFRGSDANTIFVLFPRVYAAHQSQREERNTGYADGTLAGATFVCPFIDFFLGLGLLRAPLTTFSEASRTYLESPAANGMKVFGGHNEGGPIHAHTSLITGVTPSTKTRRSNFVDLFEGKNVGATNTFGNVEYDNTDPALTTSIEVRSQLGGKSDAQPGSRSLTNEQLISIGIHALRPGSTYESYPQGFVMTNMLRAPHLYSALYPAAFNGWHAWTYAPTVYGGLYSSFGVSGDQAPAWKDREGRAQFWMMQDGFYVGAATGSVPWTVRWRTAAPTTGTWKRGDVVWNTEPAASGYAGWICTTAGTPGTWKQFGAIEP